MDTSLENILPSDHAAASLVGRIWNPDAAGPSLVCVRDGAILDITSADAPTMRDLLEMDDPASFVRSALGASLGAVEEIAANSVAHRSDATRPHMLAPFDLQAVKACGVTFAQSIIERVIEEMAKGDAAQADAIRARCIDILGSSLTSVKAGSEEAEGVKQALIEAGMWSQYLEVAIGPDAEVFTKAPVLSSVGPDAEIGIRSDSTWNNPEPEIALLVDSRGNAVGATLGNDVNLRDFEGRSALLLGKAKDNNASCALGPLVRLFDDGFTIDDVRRAEVQLRIEGEDGYVLEGTSSMSQISRDPLDLVRQTLSEHQYPDGFALFLGTLFAPVQDRDEPGRGFTHKIGDRVTIASDRLGRLTNRVVTSRDAAPWDFGIRALIANLAGRGLLETSK